MVRQIKKEKIEQHTPPRFCIEVVSWFSRFWLFFTSRKKRLWLMGSALLFLALASRSIWRFPVGRGFVIVEWWNTEEGRGRTKGKLVYSGDVLTARESLEKSLPTVCLLCAAGCPVHNRLGGKVALCRQVTPRWLAPSCAIFTGQSARKPMIAGKWVWAVKGEITL